MTEMEGKEKEGREKGEGNGCRPLASVSRFTIVHRRSFVSDSKSAETTKYRSTLIYGLTEEPVHVLCTLIEQAVRVATQYGPPFSCLRSKSSIIPFCLRLRDVVLTNRKILLATRDLKVWGFL